MRRVQLPAASTVPSFEVQLERDSSNEKFILTIVNPRAERLDIKLSFGTAGFSDTTPVNKLTCRCPTGYSHHGDEARHNE
jgi:hypothetical protein